VLQYGINNGDTNVLIQKHCHRSSGGIGSHHRLLHAEAKSHNASGQASNLSTCTTCSTC